jgi:hypothetical protein
MTQAPAHRETQVVQHTVQKRKTPELPRDLFDESDIAEVPVRPPPRGLGRFSALDPMLSFHFKVRADLSL